MTSNEMLFVRVKISCKEMFVGFTVTQDNFRLRLQVY